MDFSKANRLYPRLAQHGILLNNSSVVAVSAVHDGYVLQKSIARAPIGGRLLTQCMLQSLESKGIAVKPSYSFKRSVNAAGQYEVSSLLSADPQIVHLHLS